MDSFNEQYLFNEQKISMAHNLFTEDKVALTGIIALLEEDEAAFTGVNLLLPSTGIILSKRESTGISQDESEVRGCGGGMATTGNSARHKDELHDHCRGQTDGGGVIGLYRGERGRE